MLEYIAKEHALRKLGELSREPAYQHDGEDYYVGICDASCVINEIKAADVAPVRHGEWEIVVGSNGNEYMVCTCCRVSQDLTGVFSYCPNCGAKMMEG